MANYDSSYDTNSHIRNIQMVMDLVIIPMLIERATIHDASKLVDPEKSCYDEYIPKLKEAKYGTDEYNQIKKEMEDKGLAHHYSVSRHHPDHFKNGINDMNLIDIIEMFADWYAASLRSDTGFDKGLGMNFEKFGIDTQLAKILENTYNDILKPFDSFAKMKSTNGKIQIATQTKELMDDLSKNDDAHAWRHPLTLYIAENMMKQIMIKNTMVAVDEKIANKEITNITQLREFVYNFVNESYGNSRVSKEVREHNQKEMFAIILMTHDVKSLSE